MYAPKPYLWNFLLTFVWAGHPPELCSCLGRPARTQLAPSLAASWSRWFPKQLFRRNLPQGLHLVGSNGFSTRKENKDMEPTFAFPSFNNSFPQHWEETGAYSRLRGQGFVWFLTPMLGGALSSPDEVHWPSVYLTPF